MINEADSQVKVRDWLMNQGADYGIDNSMIGWNSNTGSVTLGGDDFLKPDKIENGSSWADNNALRSAFDTYTKQRGIQSNKEKYNVSNFGYDNPYSAKIDELLKSVLNPSNFNYNAESDPSFQAYKQQYAKAGDNALANTMSEASAMTGGRLNTWAVSAGNQAKANFDQRLMDVIPQLEQMAYQRYQTDLANKRGNLNTLLDIDNRDFQRAISNRDFNYGMDRDKLSDARYSDELKYNRGRDAISDKRYETEWNYGVGRDKIGDERYDKEFERSGEQWDKQFSESVRQANQANARAWANHNLSQAEFAYRKANDAKEWNYKMEQAAKEKVENPDELGLLYQEMMRAKDPQEWLMNNSDVIPTDELKLLVQWAKKDSGMNFTIIPN